MPRGPRLDAPGSLHHIMVRGIERRKIFESDRDKEDCLARSIFCYLSSRQLGWTGRQLSEELHITPAAVHYAALRGEELLRENRKMEEQINSYLKDLTTLDLTLRPLDPLDLIIFTGHHISKWLIKS